MPQYSTDPGRPLASYEVFKLPIEEFQRLLSQGLSLDQVYLLEQATKKEIRLKDFSSERVKSNITTLIRKGLITSAGSITLKGRAILETLGSEGSASTQPVEDLDAKMDKDFEQWWKAFPSTSQFEHKGREFKGDRGLRQKKEECRMLYKKIINQGEYTAQDLLGALTYEVVLKKEASVREGENKLKYMRNTLSYLNGGIFENFVEGSRKKSPTVISRDNFDI